MLLSGLVLLLAGAVLLFGWGLGIDTLRRLPPFSAGMAISSALGLFGIALCLLVDIVAPRSGLRPFQTAAAAVLFAVAVIDLLLLALEPGRGIDQVVFAFPDSRAQIYMSPATAICLALAAGCQLIPTHRRQSGNGNRSGALVAAGIVLTVLALVGYIYDSSALYEVFAFSAMAPHTAIGFFLLFLAFALARPTWGWMRVVVGGGPGSAMLRRTLPFVIVGPLVFCWFTLFAVDFGVFNANFRLSVLAIAGAVGLIVPLFWSALRENADARALMKSNDRLRQALADRDVLLKEVYHRVKNNLQFVDAMLGLEAKDGGTDRLAPRLAAIRGRIHAMGLVHQHLIGAPGLASLNLQNFLAELCANQARAAGFDARGIRVETQVEPVRVDLDRAVPIGLIVTELLANAGKHAFPAGRSGVIRVEAERGQDDNLVLTVRDDGVGRDAPALAAGQVGSMIVRSLAAQLGARMDVRDSGGYRIEFAIPFSVG